MFTYLARRILYAIPVLIGVNLITFILFFAVNTPDDIARSHLGAKHITQQSLERWKASHGYDKPLFFNKEKAGHKTVTDTLFFTKSFALFAFQFGISDGGRDITYDVKQRMWPSFALAAPILLVGLLINITFALLMVFFLRGVLIYFKKIDINYLYIIFWLGPLAVPT